MKSAKRFLWLTAGWTLVLTFSISMIFCKKYNGSDRPDSSAKPLSTRDGSRQQPSGGTPQKKPEFKEDRLFLATEFSDPYIGLVRTECKFDKPRWNLKVSVRQTDQGNWAIVNQEISDGRFRYLVDSINRRAEKQPIERLDQWDKVNASTLCLDPSWQRLRTFKFDEYIEKYKGYYDVIPREADKVGAIPVTRYEVKRPDGYVLEWIYVDKNNLIRRVVHDPGGGVGQEMVIEIRQLDLDPTFSDSDFRPPADYVIEESKE